MATKMRAKKSIEAELAILLELQNEVGEKLGFVEGVAIGRAIQALQYALNEGESVSDEYQQMLKN